MATENLGRVVGTDGTNGKNGINGTNGNDGSTFIPIPTVVESTLTLSWNNDGERPNPDPVSITAPTGKNGVDGDDGFSPTVVVKTETETEYILTVTDKNGSFDTPNLQGGGGGGSGEDGATFIPSGTVDGSTITFSWENDKGKPNPTPVELTAPQGVKGDKGDPGENGAKGDPGENGSKGDPGTNGSDAIINGVNTLTIEEGSNIQITQNGSVLTISSTASGGIADAPIDGEIYGRKNGQWDIVTGGGDSNVIKYSLPGFTIPSGSWSGSEQNRGFTYTPINKPENMSEYIPQIIFTAESVMIAPLYRFTVSSTDVSIIISVNSGDEVMPDLVVERVILEKVVEF